MSEKIVREIQSLQPTAVIELFELEVGGDTYRFHAGTNELSGPVVWRGQTYEPFPIRAEGFDISGQGQLPRPKLSVANVGGLISQLLGTQDVVGARVVRRRTLAKFLDAVNFEDGNPDADPAAEFPQDIFYIDRKSAETATVVEFELVSALDVTGVKLPRRQIIQNSCAWKYRGPECGYAGPAVADELDVPTGDPARDKCGKRLSSCKLRYGQDSVLPFGGFPAAGLIRV